MTLDQAQGNWYHFIETIYRIKTILTAKQLLNVVSYLIVIFLVGSANCYSEEYFLQGRARGIGDEFMEPSGRWAENV
jgi:hypothetical protein